jgi:hypothetical protein
LKIILWEEKEISIPEMSEAWITEISEKYISLYNKLIEPSFIKESKEFNVDKIQSAYDSFSQTYYE